MKHLLSSLLLLLSITLSFAQEKKSLTHDDYDLWKTIRDTKLSKKGDVVVSSIATVTGRGDGYLQVYNTRTGNSNEFKNGYKAEISADGDYVIFLRKPEYELTRQEKKDEVKEDKRSKDDLFIYDVKKDKLVDSIMRVKSFKVPEAATGWAVIEKHKDIKAKKEADEAGEKEKTSDTLTSENLAEKGEYALVYDLKKNSADTIFQIKSYEIAEEGDALYFSTTRGKKKGDIGVYAYSFQNSNPIPIDTGRFVYDKLAVDKEGKQLAYISAKDSTEKDSLQFELFHFKDQKLQQVTDTLGKNLREDWELSSAQTPQFSDNGERLFFHSRPARQFDIDTTLLEDEVPEVDVWNYQDKLIQPEQKARLKQLENKAYLSFINTETGEVISLHDEELDYVNLDEKGEQQYILGYTSSPYDVERSWEYPWQRDYYIVNTNNGNKELALEGASGNPYLSPDGKFAVYFDLTSQDWWVLDLAKNETRNLTEALSVEFHEEDNDVPADPGAYGFGGFSKEGNALLYDQFDVWSAALDKNSTPVNITKDGREKNIQYRSLRLDDENRTEASYFDKKLLLNAFDKTSKTGSLYTLNVRNGKKDALVETTDMLLSGFELAEEKDVLVYRKQNFTNYPDLYLWKSKKQPDVRITNVNPQQEEFQWGTSELFSWEAYDGTKLEGIIYKPENFDPNKKYPMISYFYEKRSDNLNSYHIPQPSASTVNMSYLVSNDYVVFVPDIVYKDGEPGESAYNAIVSGVEAVEDLGYVDSDNIAIQGQSWGGYQVAYLVTKTNKFKAAMAGAPVSNMTSAYGGIRWQTGLSRAFQYEKTQSRIGKNLWEGFDSYIENSPLFGIPDIETPLLMMHNDADGAVPYYQGIEMFMGMRRLNKPVWLLVYNDEAHNLTKMKNKQDLSIRMMQFFDHYLKNEPAPLWMTEGLPAIKKGKDLQYGLDQRKETGEEQGQTFSN